MRNEPPAKLLASPTLVIKEPDGRRVEVAALLQPVAIDEEPSTWGRVRFEAKVIAPGDTRVPFEDYDPILEDNRKRSARSAFKPFWTGD